MKRFQGKVRWYGQGFGFIELHGSEDVFVHHSAVGDDDLLPGELVEFSLSSHNDKPCAINVVRKKRELTTRTYTCGECGSVMELSEIVIGDKWE